MHSNNWLRSTLGLFVVFSILLCGCEIELISPYNERVVEAIITVNRELDHLLTSCEGLLEAGKTDEAAYAHFEQDYDALEVDIRSLQLEVSLIPKSDETVEMLDDLLTILEDLRSLHRLGLSLDIIELQRITFQGQCRDILTLEQVKEGN